MNTFFHTEYFFPRKSPVNCLLPPEMDERETPRKIGAVRKPSQKRPFRTRSITLPEMNPCNAHGIVHSRSAFAFSSLASRHHRGTKICGGATTTHRFHRKWRTRSKCRAHLSSPQPQLAESQSSWTFLRKYRAGREVQINVRRSERVGEIRAVFFTTCAW